MIVIALIQILLFSFTFKFLFQMLKIFLVSFQDSGMQSLKHDDLFQFDSETKCTFRLR